MGLDYFLNKYIIVTKNDGKKLEGVLVDILNKDEDDYGFITLVIRIDDDKYKNVHLIEIENIGEVE